MNQVYAPDYIEAYPRLDIHQARKARNPLTSLCVYTDEKGRETGQLFVAAWELECAKIEFLIGGPFTPFGQGPYLIRTETMVGHGDPRRRFFRCPRCDARIATIVYRGNWACRKCHGLVHRSQLVQNEVLQFERFNSLRAEIGRGRPHRVRRATFEKLVVEFKDLQEKLGARCSWPSERHSRLVTANWTPAAEFGGSLAIPHHVIRNGLITPLADPYT